MALTQALRLHVAQPKPFEIKTKRGEKGELGDKAGFLPTSGVISSMKWMV